MFRLSLTELLAVVFLVMPGKFLRPMVLRFNRRTGSVVFEMSCDLWVEAVRRCDSRQSQRCRADYDGREE